MDLRDICLKYGTKFNYSKKASSEIPCHGVSVILVITGCIQIRACLPSGEDYILSYHGSGEMVIHHDTGKQMVYCQAKPDTNIAILSQNDINRLCLYEEKIISSMLEVFSKQTANIQEKLIYTATSSAKERVSQFLIDYKNRPEVYPRFLQRGEIADYIGIRRETLSRVARSLNDEKHPLYLVWLRIIEGIQIAKSPKKKPMDIWWRKKYSLEKERKSTSTPALSTVNK